MRALFFSLFLFLPLSGLNVEPFSSSAITYEFSGGRFGDNLTAYANAKWLSYKYGIPLIYRPFPLANELHIEEEETLIFSEALKSKFNRFVTLKNKKKFEPHALPPVLYSLLFFTEAIPNNNYKTHVNFDLPAWNDPGFKSLLQRLLQPKETYSPIESPEGAIRVALHVRTGIGSDAVGWTRDLMKARHCHIWDLKFPEYEYYKNQIEWLLSYFPGETLFVHLFTDHPEPEKIVKRLENDLQGQPVLFSYRSSCNRHILNVVEDFYQMSTFDCMVRGASQLSFIAEKIGNFHVCISPKKSTLRNGFVTITEVTISLPKGGR